MGLWFVDWENWNTGVGRCMMVTVKLLEREACFPGHLEFVRYGQLLSGTGAGWRSVLTVEGKE